MAASDYLPQFVATLRQHGASADTIERFQRHYETITESSYHLPCPFCFADGNESVYLTAIGQQKMLCKTCFREIALNRPPL